MDFARKHMEKYGWSDGKGLGKHENGISEALKPKLKRSVAGIGHDAAADFTDHWWSALYDKAAGNVEVKEKNGKTKKIKTKDDNFQITNSTWKMKMKNETQLEEYKDFFVKTAILSNGGSKTEKVRDSESEEEKQEKDVFKMTDEELFAACEGRTAHKGARHGLRALGKLARIERQEQMLLTQPKFNGYSHAKKIEKDKHSDVVEVTCLQSNSEMIEVKKKKKKRKHCISNDIHAQNICKNDDTLTECADSLPPLEEKVMVADSDVCDKKKSKKRKKRHADNKNNEGNDSANCNIMEIDTNSLNEDISVDKIKKKKRNDSLMCQY